MDTIETIFKELGGPAAVGRHIGVSTEHATQMRRRNSIPVKYWTALIGLAKKTNKPLNEAKLAALHAERAA